MEMKEHTKLKAYIDTIKNRKGPKGGLPAFTREEVKIMIEMDRIIAHRNQMDEESIFEEEMSPATQFMIAAGFLTMEQNGNQPVHFACYPSGEIRFCVGMPEPGDDGFPIARPGMHFSQ